MIYFSGATDLIEKKQLCGKRKNKRDDEIKKEFLNLLFYCETESVRI